MFSVVGTWGYEVALIIFLWKPRLSVEVCVWLLEDISIREWTAWHFKVWLLKDISIRDWTTWKWQQVFKVWLLKHFSNRVVKHDIHFFIFGGSYISHPLGYILNNTPHLYIDFPSPFHSSLLVRRDTTAVGNLSGTFQKGLILNLASTAGSQRCWLNIHRYFHFSLSLFIYIYIWSPHSEPRSTPFPSAHWLLRCRNLKGERWTNIFPQIYIYIYICTNYRFKNTKIQSNIWVEPQMWTLEMWNFLFKDSTWKCSFWTFFIKLWVGPQMWTLADWNFLFKDSTWKCSFWTFFIKLWVGPQMWTLADWNFLFKEWVV